MTEPDPWKAPLPLEVDRIQSSRSAVGETRLRLGGRWLNPHREASDEQDGGLLVVYVEGRRHRFAPDRDAAGDQEDQSGRWSASFTVPSWAEPRQVGQAALWLGTAVIPVPPLHGAAAAVRVDEEGGRPAGAPTAVSSTPARDDEPTEPPRAGPLADLLLKETVGALHDELEQRAAEIAQVRGALAAAQSELSARDARQSQLETVLAELRGELERLRGAVEKQREQLEQKSAEAVALRERLAAAEAASELRAAETVALRAELGAANVSREAAVSETAGLRCELERIGSELAATHERVASETGDLGEANRLLADAKALAAELGGGGAGDDRP
jgi:hypothetical protein